MIDHEPEAGMALGDSVDRRDLTRDRHHHRNARALRGRPQPVGCPVGQPRPLLLRVEREAHAEHPGLVPPAIDEWPAVRLLQREPAHHRELVGMESRRLEREVVALAFPRRRHDHGAINAGLLHAPERHVLADWIGLLGPLRSAWRPWTVGAIGRPQMNLRVGDQHISRLRA